MSNALRLTRDVSIDECDWLDRDFLAGETVYRFHGATYGCISPNGVAVSLTDGEGPFLEMPYDA